MCRLAILQRILYPSSSQRREGAHPQPGALRRSVTLLLFSEVGRAGQTPEGGRRDTSYLWPSISFVTRRRLTFLRFIIITCGEATQVDKSFFSFSFSFSPNLPRPPFYRSLCHKRINCPPIISQRGHWSLAPIVVDFWGTGRDQ